MAAERILRDFLLLARIYSALLAIKIAVNQSLQSLKLYLRLCRNPLPQRHLVGLELAHLLRPAAHGCGAQVGVELLGVWLIGDVGEPACQFGGGDCAGGVLGRGPSPKRASFCHGG